MQMKQRAIMATALHGYSALKEICDHSFEGITYGQKSMNYFVSENARMIRAAAPNVNLSTYKGISVPNEYLISKGTLPSISAKYDEELIGFTMSISGQFQSTTQPTIEAILKGLGVSSVGDYVTFIFLVGPKTSDASVYWLRIHLTSDNKSKVVAWNGNILTNLAEGVDFETNIDNFTPNDFVLKTIVVDDNKSATLVANIGDWGDSAQSFGAIISHKADTIWQRSTSIMSMKSNVYNYAEALATYPESGEKILNGGNM